MQMHDFLDLKLDEAYSSQGVEEIIAFYCADVFERFAVA